MRKNSIFTILTLTYIKFHGDSLRYVFFLLLKKPCAIRSYYVLWTFIEKMKRGKFATIPSFIFSPFKVSIFLSYRKANGIVAVPHV